jgi:hypothetical protein
LDEESAYEEPDSFIHESSDRSIDRTRAKIEEFAQQYAEKKVVSTASSQRGEVDPKPPPPPPPVSYAMDRALRDSNDNIAPASRRSP